MKLTSGTVVAGKVEVDGERLADGTRVTILVPERDSDFDLTVEQKAELLAAMSEPDSDLLDAGDLLRDVRAPR
jgi:redox-sensitive bicupin YhaK (pirin superfamily)